MCGLARFESNEHSNQATENFITITRLKPFILKRVNGFFHTRIQLSRPIFVVGDLGLWHGRRMGYKEIECGNISDCLYTERDIDNVTWFTLNFININAL